MSYAHARQECKVFIGGLNWETTDEKLRRYFENYGAVLEAFVSYDRHTMKPRGFGFVVFEDPAVADKVVSLQHTIDRREVEAKKAVPKEETPSCRGPSGGCGSRTKKIFVGGLAPSVDEAAFRSFFEQYGTVDDAVVMYDHDNKRPRGFGFVTFCNEESVERVFVNGSLQTLHDKQIEIKQAVPKDQMAPPPPPAGHPQRPPLRTGSGPFTAACVGSPGLSRSRGGLGYSNGCGLMGSPVPGLNGLGSPGGSGLDAPHVGTGLGMSASLPASLSGGLNGTGLHSNDIAAQLGVLSAAAAGGWPSSGAMVAGGPLSSSLAQLSSSYGNGYGGFGSGGAGESSFGSLASSFTGWDGLDRSLLAGGGARGAHMPPGAAALWETASGLQTSGSFGDVTPYLQGMGSLGKDLGGFTSLGGSTSSSYAEAPLGTYM